MIETLEAVVVDTDVMSFVFNRDPVLGPRYEELLAKHFLVIPFIVMGEMRYGARSRGWGVARSTRLEAFLERRAWAFPDAETCRIWAAVRADGRRKGRPIERQDAWIAAVALQLDLPLVTHNRGHFSNVSVLQVLTA